MSVVEHGDNLVHDEIRVTELCITASNRGVMLYLARMRMRDCLCGPQRVCGVAMKVGLDCN